MRKIELKNDTLVLEEKGILGFLEREVTHFGNSAKVDCPKKFMKLSALHFIPYGVSFLFVNSLDALRA